MTHNAVLHQRALQVKMASVCAVPDPRIGIKEPLPDRLDQVFVDEFRGNEGRVVPNVWLGMVEQRNQVGHRALSERDKTSCNRRDIPAGGNPGVRFVAIEPQLARKFPRKGRKGALSDRE